MQWVLLVVLIILLALGIPLYIFTRFKIEEDVSAIEASLLTQDELPVKVKTASIILKGFWQCPGVVDYADGVLNLRPNFGAHTQIALTDVDGIVFSTRFNCKFYPGQTGIILFVPGSWRMGFLVTDIEPWRSLIMNAVEQNCNVE